MAEMVVFPPAKINLGLNVVRRRDDGFHDIESVMVPIPLHDILEVVLDADLPPGEVIFDRTGIEIPGDPLQDLCLQAVEMMRKDHVLPGMRIHLHKVIPTGAGLGGGSSDGAHMLMLLDRLLGSPQGGDLYQMAASLGSDVPFFLDHRPQLAEGRGELLQPIHLALEGKWLMLVSPGVHVATADVYRAMQPSGYDLGLAEKLQRPIAEWQTSIRNSMEEPVFKAYPAVAAVKERLLNAGAEYAAMSGSGSSVFGIFNDRPGPLEWPAGHKVWILRLPGFS